MAFHSKWLSDIQEALLANEATTISALRIGLNDDSAEKLAEAFEGNTSVSKLDLSGNFIGDRGAGAIFKVLAQSSTVLLVDLSRNNLGLAGACHAARCLRGNKCLTSLNLWKNDLGSAGAIEICRALLRHPSIATLCLSHCNIGHQAGEVLSTFLKRSRSIASLDLSNNSLGDRCAQAVGQGLIHNSTLTSLDLGHNSISREGGHHIAHALRTNKVLEELLLQGNSLGPHGADHFARALKQNKVLTKLDLSLNGLGPEGGEALGPLILDSVLTSLLLAGNSMGFPAVQYLMDTLVQNDTLTVLDVSSNWPVHCTDPDKCLGQFRPTLEMNYRLQFLHVSYPLHCLHGCYYADEVERLLALNRVQRLVLALHREPLGPEPQSGQLLKFRMLSGVVAQDLDGNEVAIQASPNMTVGMLKDAVKARLTTADRRVDVVLPGGHLLRRTKDELRLAEIWADV